MLWLSEIIGEGLCSRYIADSNTGDQGAGNDDIKNILRTLIVPPLLEIHGFLKVLIYYRYTSGIHTFRILSPTTTY